MSEQPDLSDLPGLPDLSDLPGLPDLSDLPDGPDPVDVDEQLAAVERFIAAVQSGSVGTSEAMAAYRDRHRPAIDRLRQELDTFEALLAPDLDPDA